MFFFIPPSPKRERFVFTAEFSHFLVTNFNIFSQKFVNKKWPNSAVKKTKKLKKKQKRSLFFGHCLLQGVRDKKNISIGDFCIIATSIVSKTQEYFWSFCKLKYFAIKFVCFVPEVYEMKSFGV
jgi:hypothetical protein